jgi:hypothetical protein
VVPSASVLGRAYPELLPGYRRLYQSERRSGMPDVRYLARLDGRCREALSRYRLPGRMPLHIFRGMVPTYTAASVLLEHKGFEQGEPGGGQGPLARAGLAVARWAQGRLSRQRGKQAWRLIESDLDMLVRGKLLQEIPDLHADAFAAVEECYARICGPERRE